MSERERRQPYQVALNILAIPVLLILAVLGYAFLGSMIDKVPSEYRQWAWLAAIIGVALMIGGKWRR